jgi:hypothetical protein
MSASELWMNSQSKESLWKILHQRKNQKKAGKVHLEELPWCGFQIATFPHHQIWGVKIFEEILHRRRMEALNHGRKSDDILGLKSGPYEVQPVNEFVSILNACAWAFSCNNVVNLY